MKRRSKSYREKLSIIDDSSNERPIDEAITLVRNVSGEGNKSIRLSLPLNWSSKSVVLKGSVIFRNPPQMITCAVISDGFDSLLEENELLKIFSFAQFSELMSKSGKRNWGFDKLFAHPSLATKLKPFARILSAKNCFPNQKNGTLTETIDQSKINEASSKVELRTDKNGNINVLIGQTSFSDQQIIENFNDLLKSVFSLKPSNWKSDFLKKATISSTTSPGIKVSVF